MTSLGSVFASEKRLVDYFVICGLDLDSGLEPDALSGERPPSGFFFGRSELLCDEESARFSWLTILRSLARVAARRKLRLLTRTLVTRAAAAPIPSLT